MVSLIPIIVTALAIIGIVQFALRHPPSGGLAIRSTEDISQEVEDFNFEIAEFPERGELLECGYCGGMIRTEEYKEGRCPICSAPRRRLTYSR